MKVRMSNPLLPPDQTIDVLEDAVSGHERAGWQVITDDEPARSMEPAVTEPAATTVDRPAAGARRTSTSPVSTGTGKE